MSDIRLIEPLSGWIELHLETKLLTPPILRVRVRPLTGLDTVDSYAGGDRKMSEMSLSRALGAIAEWDLTLNGKPLPCTDAVKQQYGAYLRLLLAQPIAPAPGEDAGEEGPYRFAATKIQQIANDEATFLKNLSTTSA